MSSSLPNEKMSYLKQFTNPLWSLVLAPISYSLLGFILALKSTVTSWSSWFVIFFFLLMLNFQELLFSKFYKVPKKNRTVVLIISNLLLLLPIAYMIQVVNFRLGILALLVVLVNHAKIYPITTQHPAYFYQLLLNSFTKFAIGNFLTYYLLVGHVSSSIFWLCLSFSLIGIYVLHTKQKIEEQKRAVTPTTITWHKALISLLNINWLLSTVLALVLLRNHYGLIALCLLGGTLLIPLLFQLSFRHSLKGSHVVTYYYWYSTLLAILLAVFYQ